ALIESVMFFWIFGMDNAWRQLHLGAERRVPRFFYPIMKYVTPLYCLVLFAAWGYQNGWDVLTMKNVAEADRLWVWGTRGLIVALIALFGVLLWKASRRWEPRPASDDQGGPT
ncbi:MAG: hypothetical protein JW797_20020, partial [Bradymonadales bacterium]|nr:hypothetical protein [Bradymonadales bacterium]